MPAPKITMAGSTPLKKLGHTIGKNHGTNPTAKMRGESAPTEITFGK